MKHIYRQLDFLAEPGVANEILEDEAKSCLAVAQFSWNIFCLGQGGRGAQVLAHPV